MRISLIMPIKPTAFPNCILTRRRWHPSGIVISESTVRVCPSATGLFSNCFHEELTLL